MNLSSLKNLIKKIIYFIEDRFEKIKNNILYFSGYYEWLLKAKTKKGVNLIVLAYHSVKNGPVKYSGLEVSINNFEEHLSLIRKYFDIITLDKAIDYLGNDPTKIKNKVVITFDDGYRDNYKVVFPFLKKNSIPSTIFLTTDPVKNNSLIWTNKIEESFALTKNREIFFEEFGLLDISTKPKKMIAFRRITKYLKYQDSIKRVKLIEAVVDRLSDNCVENTSERFEMLLPENIREMSKEGITFENHTSSHPVVSMLRDEDFRKEIEGSNSSIFEWTGRKSRYFAYPFGHQQDISERSKKILKDFGFKAAFTLFRGTNNPETDRYEMKRIPVKNFSVADFASFILKYL